MKKRTCGSEPNKPIGRRGPSPAKTAATRRALIEAALTEFLDNGFAATRMTDVAMRAGLAKGTAYLYFADKEALFADVLREVMQQATASRPHARPRSDEPTRDFLKRTVPPILRELQNTNRFRVLHLVVSEGQRFPAVTEIYRAVAIEPVLRLVRMYAKRAERRGELRSDALSHLPLLMVAPVVISSLWNLLFARADLLDVAAVFEGFLDLTFTAKIEQMSGQ